MASKEVFNDSRHEHKLVLFEGHPKYKCSGCKAFGANRVFKCKSCPDYMLHEPCANLPDEYIHPFSHEKQLQFRAKTLGRHHCDACGEVLRGFMFESHGWSPLGKLKLHPLCMTLPPNLSYDGHKNHSLKLHVEGGKYKCTHCTKENEKWKYKCEMTTCKVNLDMNCAIVHFHGMSEHGANLVQRPSRLKRVMKRVSGGTTFVGKNFAEGAAEGFAVVGVGLVAAGVGGSQAFGDDEEEGDENEEEDGEEEEEEDRSTGVLFEVK